MITVTEARAVWCEGSDDPSLAATTTGAVVPVEGSAIGATEVTGVKTAGARLAVTDDDSSKLVREDGAFLGLGSMGGATFDNTMLWVLGMRWKLVLIFGCAGVGSLSAGRVSDNNLEAAAVLGLGSV